MNKTGEHKVFLSYAKEDLDEVRKVYEGLGKRGLSVWFDDVDLRPGPWKPQVKKAINRSRFFVICISEAALRKTGDDTPGFQDEELNWAYNISQTVSDKEFAIVPVRLEDCDRGDTRLSSSQQYDLFNDFEKELDKLAIHLGGHSLSDAGAVEERSEDEKMLDNLTGKATAAYYAGEYEKAITFLNSVLAEKPDYHWALSNKGVALVKLGRYEEAIEAYDSAIKINPDYHDAWYNKGFVLEKFGRYNEAIEAVARAIEIKPDRHELWLGKGVVLERSGCYEEAIEAYDRSIEINHDYHDAWHNKGLALGELGRYEEAIEAFVRAIEINPDYHEAWHGKGLALGELGRYEGAIEAFDRAIEFKPDDHGAWYNKGIALDKLERHEEAKEAFGRAEKLK